MDFRGFLAALYSDWVSRMSGIVSLLLTGVSFAFPSANQKVAFLIAAAICFFVGAVKIWTTEHRARTAAEEAKLPDLQAKVSLCSVACLNGKDAVLICNFTAMNKGADSFLELRYLAVTLPDQSVHVGKLMLNNANDTDIPANGSTPGIRLLRSDYLGIKFIEDPLKRGTKVSAWGLFVLPGVPQLAVAKGSHINATFVDIAEKEVTVSHVLGSLRSTGIYAPFIS